MNYDDSTEQEINIQNVVELLRELSPDDRLKVFRYFCTRCGSTDSYCQCWNDE
jgi:hypothetical protein